MSNWQITCRESLAAGCEKAYAELFDRLGERMVRVATTLLSDRQDAEDAVADVFLNLLRSRRKLAEVQNLSAYIFTALRRESAKHYARRSRQRDLLDAAAKQAKGSASDETSDSSNEPLNRAIQKLPDEQREVLSLKIDGELTFAEIATVLDISPNTSASRYRYALEKLRQTLEETP